MKVLKTVLAFLLILSSMSMSISAQGSEFSCTVEEWASMLNSLTENFLELTSQVTDETSILETTLLIKAGVDSIYAICSNGTFSEETHSNGIIGPISFSGTLYQITLSSSDGGSSFSTTVIEGDCGFTPPSIFTDMEGTTETDLWEPGGTCVAMFEVETYGASGWELVFERLR